MTTVEDYGNADLVIEKWSGYEIIFRAVTEKGEAFLTAYCDENKKAEPVDTWEEGDQKGVESIGFSPVELDHFKRIASAAGVKLQNRTVGLPFCI
jgi:hypothetical protein